MVVRIGRQARGRVKTYLEEWREHRGLKQHDLAELMGTTVPTISRYETGSRTPTLDFLSSAAEVLFCDITDLLTRTPDMPDIRALVAKAMPEDQRRIYGLVEGFLKTGTDG